MKGLIVLIFAFFTKLCSCNDLDSYEVNRIELTPIHDAVIFNDIADIMAEFENNMYTELNTPITNYGESDEDIEDLLSEYQHYLDRAHKKRVNYIEKNKSKNKVPLIRQEKYIKTTNAHTDDKINYYFKGMKHYPNPFFKALETKFVMKPDLSFKQNYENIPKSTSLIDLPPTMPKGSYDPLLTSCRCKVNQIPCKCPCKQCIVTIAPESVKDLNQDNKNHNSSNDKLSIRIKVDVQLPNLVELINFLKYHKYDKGDDFERSISKEYQSTVNIQNPYPNFGMPLNMLDFNNNFMKSGSPLRKITIHKKKKSRLNNNNNKKHKTKKLYNIHHDNLDTQLQLNNTEIIHNLDNNNNITIHINDTKDIKIKTDNTIKPDTVESLASNKTKMEVPDTNINKSFGIKNITNNDENVTNESTKIENSIENDYKENITTDQPLRLKREIIQYGVIPIEAINTINKTNKAQQNNLTVLYHNRSDRVLNVTDANLLYWPIEYQNISVPTKNITSMIMEREAKKRKMNMTHEAIRSNRTKALEKAIFGDVDWNDVDTVAPVFMSFVGKYIRGVLTFCSDIVCHSMKCSNKVCTHRICKPKNRFNQNGHCSGNNNTDSVANMESIMDLPSIIAFEIVDILQDNMAGKIYGKMTLCINSKCCTFVAAKKVFQKSKCTLKKVDVSGHCPNLKNAKMK